jgi:hypothetical protein
MQLSECGSGWGGVGKRGVMRFEWWSNHGVAVGIDTVRGCYMAVRKNIIFLKKT